VALSAIWFIPHHSVYVASQPLPVVNPSNNLMMGTNVTDRIPGWTVISPLQPLFANLRPLTLTRPLHPKLKETIV